MAAYSPVASDMASGSSISFSISVVDCTEVSLGSCTSFVSAVGTSSLSAPSVSALALLLLPLSTSAGLASLFFKVALAALVIAAVGVETANGEAARGADC